MIDRKLRLVLSGALVTGLLIGCDGNPEAPKADPNAPTPTKGTVDPSAKVPKNPSAAKSKGNTAVGQ